MTTTRRSPRFTRAMVPVALAALLVTACSSSSSAPPSARTSPPPASGGSATSVPPSSGPAASPTRAEGWRADLAMLVPEMDRIHPDLTHGASRADLDAAVAALSASVDTASDDALMVGVLRIVALVSAAGCDGHTGAFVWGAGTYPVESLPLRLWLFADANGDDDVVIVDALPPYEHLIGARVDAIEGQATADVIAAIDPIVPRDNAQTVRLLMPRFLLIPQVLRGLGLADEGPIELTVSPVADPSETVDVEPVTIAAYNDWAGPYGLHLPADPAVRYLSRIDDALWWEMLDDGETLYVQYNRVDRLPATQVADLEAALGAPNVASVVLDIRHNFGGELSALDAITPVFNGAPGTDPDQLFVFTGRNTFSAGSMLAARLEPGANVTLLGEATGGCPTIWSDPSTVDLPWSGISVSVAGDVAVGVDPEDTRLTIEPDVSAILAPEEWLAGVDPALELIDVDAS